MPDASAEGTCERCGGQGYRVLKMKGRPASARRCECHESCTRCHGSGYVLIPAGASAVAQPCACRHLDERIALFNATSVPATVARASFETYRAKHPDQIAAKAAAEEFAKKFRHDRETHGLLLYGPPGTGKTHLLASIVRYLALEKGVPCRYVEFMLLLSEIKAAFGSNRGYLDVLGPLAKTPVLVIDELGKERGTDWERSMLDELISRRYNAGLTTLFATNYYCEDRKVPEREGGLVQTRSREFQREAEAMTLAQRVGDRIYSRLREMCRVMLRVEGADRRQSGWIDDDWD
jgi:DNA replication protein DnaC